MKKTRIDLFEDEVVVSQKEYYKIKAYDRIKKLVIKIIEIVDKEDLAPSK